MSENKHTPEPWRTDAECGFPQDIHDSKGNLFLRCGSDIDNDIYGEANARRIVACVNACAGISTENLEDNVPVKELARRYNTAIKQRDELLAVLEKFIAWNKAYPSSRIYSAPAIRVIAKELDQIAEQAEAAIRKLGEQ